MSSQLDLKSSVALTDTLSHSGKFGSKINNESSVLMGEESKLMLDIYERLGLGGIDAKLDNVNAIKKTADDALKIANRADLKASDAQEDIVKLTGMGTIKWGLGICASAIIAITVFVLGIVLN